MGEDLWIIAKKIGVFVCIQDQKGSFEFAIAYAVIGGFSKFACGFIIGKSDPDLMFGKVFGKSFRNIVSKNEFVLAVFFYFSCCRSGVKSSVSPNKSFLFSFSYCKGIFKTIRAFS
jgi:hypothetical protein